MAGLTPMGLILTLLDPEYARGVNMAKVVGENRRLLKSAIKLAERNGLYYLFMRTLKELDLDLPFESEKRWQEENRRLNELKTTITLLNDVAESSGMKYIWIKSCNQIPHVPRDVDIFVLPEEKGKIAGAFEAKGMRYVDASDIETSLVKEGCLKLDIYTRIYYMTVDFIDDAFLHKHRVKQSVFGLEHPGLDAEADFMLLLVHGLFGHGTMSLLDFLQLKRRYRDIRDIAICRDYALKRGWGAAFDLALARFEDVQKRVYGRESVRFPYLFAAGFILRCASMIEGLNLGWRKKAAFYLSFNLEQLRESQKESALYLRVRSFEPAMKLIRAGITFLKTMRGDRTSG